MKIKSFLVSMFAIAALASCSNNDELDNLVPDNQTADKAYLALSIAMPQGAATRAPGDPTTTPGTTEESKLTEIYVIGLENGTIRGRYLVASDKTGKDPGAIEVSPKLTHVFVIANPSAAMFQRMNSAATFTAMNLAMEEAIDNVIESKPEGGTKTANFMMTSAGGTGYTTDGLMPVEPVKVMGDKPVDITNAQNTAIQNKKTIKIDRIVSRGTMTVAENVVVVPGAKAKIEGWLFNTTNKTYLPYAELMPYSQSTTSEWARYRKDNNWEFIEGSNDSTTPPTLTPEGLLAAFNWLHNHDKQPALDKSSWTAAGTTKYCLENTMTEVGGEGAGGQVYGNTTKIVIKAQFAPEGFELGQHWFRISGVPYDLAGLIAYYNKYKDGDAVFKTDMDNFATVVFNKPTVDALVDADLDKAINGGYVAATLDKYIVEYFHKSICYYDVLIKHDGRVDPRQLGRWGVVRNNDYTINVTKIGKAGLPYIPDPTDPAIKDPENPDPDQPNDETQSFIAVTIEVNPWTSWTQDTEL